MYIITLKWLESYVWTYWKPTCIPIEQCLKQPGTISFSILHTFKVIYRRNCWSRLQSYLWCLFLPHLSQHLIYSTYFVNFQRLMYGYCPKYYYFLDRQFLRYALFTLPHYSAWTPRSTTVNVLWYSTHPWYIGSKQASSTSKSLGGQNGFRVV